MKVHLPASAHQQLSRYLLSEIYRVDGSRREAWTSNHWLTYGALSTLKDCGRYFDVHAGHGFDGRYEDNFRGDSIFTRPWARTTAKLLKSPLYWWRWASDNVPPPMDYLSAYRRLWGASGAIPYHEMIRARNLSEQHILAHHHFNVMAAHAPGAFKAGIWYLEIGPGTGYLASLVRGRVPGAKIILIDLPNILPFSFLFLSKQFPGIRIRLPHEVASEDKFDGRDGADVVCLSPEQVDLVPSHSIHAAANVTSFGEMLPKTVARYFDMLRWVLVRDVGVFYCANRVEKWVNYAGVSMEDNRRQKGMPMRFHEYPWSRSDRTVYFQISQMYRDVIRDNIFEKLAILNGDDHEVGTS